MAPLQENYSEALQTPARLKRAVSRWEKPQVTRILGKSEVQKGAHSRSRDPPQKKRSSA